MIDKILIDKSVLLIDKSVLQQTLAALEDADTYVHAADLEPAIDALRAALAAPQRQPRPFVECEDSQAGQSQVLQPAQPADQSCYCLNCEALGKELVAMKAAKPAEQIGVVATNPDLNTVGSAYVVKVLVDTYDAVRVGDKLYTAPPPEQQPLTKAQIKALIVATPEPDDSDVGKWVLSLIRAVEKAHKIGSRP